jgi:hypothetical protein
MSTDTAKYETCPSCGSSARVREDGSIGRHFYVRGRVRHRCAQGEIGRTPAPVGRRTTVVLDAVVPAGWTDRDVRRCASEVLRRHLAEVFVVDVAERGEAR